MPPRQTPPGFSRQRPLPPSVPPPRFSPQMAVIWDAVRPLAVLGLLCVMLSVSYLTATRGIDVDFVGFVVMATTYVILPIPYLIILIVPVFIYQTTQTDAAARNQPEGDDAHRPD